MYSPDFSSVDLMLILISPPDFQLFDVESGLVSALLSLEYVLDVSHQAQDDLVSWSTTQWALSYK